MLSSMSAPVCFCNVISSCEGSLLEVLQYEKQDFQDRLNLMGNDSFLQMSLSSLDRCLFLDYKAVFSWAQCVPVTLRCAQGQVCPDLCSDEGSIVLCHPLLSP